MSTSAITKYLSILRGFLVSVHCFGIKDGMKIPLYIAPNVQIRNITKKTLRIEAPKLRRGMICIGVDSGSDGLMSNHSSTFFGSDGASLIVFHGGFNFSRGCCIKAMQGGRIDFGDGGYCNAGTCFFCSSGISIGDGLLTGWDCTIKDNDGHQLLDDASDKALPEHAEISIGTHVWLGAHSSILKGASIPDGCVIGWGSLVTKGSTRSARIADVLAGNPARVIKSGIRWNR